MRNADFDFDTGIFHDSSTQPTAEDSNRRLPSYILFVILVVLITIASIAVGSLDQWLPQMVAQ